MGYLLEMFGISLVLTLLLELPAAALLGLRSTKGITLMILINILTNPAAVLLCWLGLPQFPVEIGVVLTEWAVLCWFSKDDRWKIPHPFLLALVCNTVSWGIGILLQTGG